MFAVGLAANTRNRTMRTNLSNPETPSAAPRLRREREYA